MINQEILKGREILIVEDNLMNRILAKVVFKNFGANVTEAESGFKAISLCIEQRFDLIAMDIQMPGMDGYETTQHLRSKLQLDTPIIALTANALKGEKEKCLAVGMNDYASKPFNESELIEICARLLGITDLEEPTPVVEQPVEQKLYDLQFLESACRGDMGFVAEMVEAFIGEAEEVKAKLPECFGTGDLPGVKAAAHRLKANIDMLGINSLYNLVREIESEATEGDVKGVLKQDIEQFSNILTQVLAQLKQEFTLA